MSHRITLIDYDSGNLLSVARAFEHCGAEVRLAQTAEGIHDAERLVLPGVGAFGDAMASLQQRGLVEPIRRYCASGRPLLGICLGMQLLASGSEEFGEHDGLSLVPGRVVPLPQKDVQGQPWRVPHVGWSALQPHAPEGWVGTPLQDVRAGADVYLVHSFHLVPEREPDRLAECDYGGHRICTAVRHDRVFGCQFHPEKSGPVGLSIVHRFLSL